MDSRKGEKKKQRKVDETKGCGRGQMRPTEKEERRIAVPEGKAISWMLLSQSKQSLCFEVDNSKRILAA